MHPKAKAEPVLVAWGIDTSGRPVFLGLAPGASKSANAWIAFLTDRGMSAPLLVISDGGKGLGAAIERCFSASKHQRCTIHVARNVLAKVPKHAQADVKGDDWAIFNGIEGVGGQVHVSARVQRDVSVEPVHGSVFGPTPLRSHVVLESVARTVNGDHVAVVKEAVQNR